MTTRDGSPAGDTDAGGVEQVLYVVGGYVGSHIVSARTLAAARAAQEEADATPYYLDFGELRRSGDLEMLADELERHDLSLLDYVAAIERSAGRAAAVTELGDRLAALGDVSFAGDDDSGAPSDSDRLRSESDLDEEVEDHFGHVLETSMSGDVPADLFDEFCVRQSPMFVDYEISYVEDERLDAMIAALEARGYTVIRD